MTLAHRVGQVSGSPGESVWDQLRTALSPIQGRPRVVNRIETARHATRDGAPYVVIHNPSAATYLRLEPAEYDLLELMDGSRTIKALVIAYYQRHGVLALPRVAGLVELLGQHSFLVETASNAYDELRRRLGRRNAEAVLQRGLRAFMYTPLPIPRADRFFAAIYSRIGRWTFDRRVIVAGTLLGAVAPALLVYEAFSGRYRLLETGGSYLLGFVILTVLWIVALACHELGHGLAVKHAGRGVSAAGFLIYYGLPTAFVDTTDIWMAPPRLRMLTSYAGPWTGLVLGGLAALAALLPWAGDVSGFLFAWGWVFVLNNLLNFNPLLELDGYYLLVDALEKPMLRARSLAFVRGPFWSMLRRRQHFTREDWLFAVFGIGALLYSSFSLVIAIRFWEVRLVPIVAEAWTSDQALARIGALVVTLFVIGPVALALWVLGRQVWRLVSRRASMVGERMSTRRNREALRALRAVPLWSGVPERRLLEIAAALRGEDIPAGTEVVRQGESGERFYVVASGTFEVQIDGRPVSQLRPGDYFGERALLNRAPRAATVVALEHSRVFSLDRDRFHALLAGDLAARARVEAAVIDRTTIAEMDLFRDLAPAELDLLVARLHSETVATGEVIVQQAESGDRFYIVRSGEVEVVRDGVRLGGLGPGEAFGEVALLMEVPRTATVRAVKPTELLTLSADAFRDLLAGYFGRRDSLRQLSHLRLESHARLIRTDASATTATMGLLTGADIGL